MYFGYKSARSFYGGVVLWTPATGYDATAVYVARIGGILYRNVLQPIVYYDHPLISFSRNSETSHLAASFDVTRADGVMIASVTYNEVNLHNTSDYVVVEGQDRTAILEKQNGRVCCDIKSTPDNSEYELDISCLLYPSSGFPVLLHPDRSKFGFGQENNNEPPNISGLTLTTDPHNSGTAIALGNRRSLYLLEIAIENFATGVRIAHTH